METAEPLGMMYRELDTRLNQCEQINFRILMFPFVVLCDSFVSPKFILAFKIYETAMALSPH